MIKFRQITLLFLMLSGLTFAQGGGLFKEKKEQIKALKIGYLTNELSLTSDEATKFWPLFNTYEDKQQEIRQLKVKNYLFKLDDLTLESLSEKEANTLLSQIENSEEEQCQLRKKFVTNLKSILPAAKILKLKKAEEQFSKKLLQQYRKGRE